MPPDLTRFAVCRLIEERIRPLLDAERQSVAHRMDHLERVARNASAILAAHPEADAEILYLAVLLHDVDQPYDDKASHVARSAAVAEQILTEIDYPRARTGRVL